MTLSEITIQAKHKTLTHVTHIRLRRSALSLHVLWGYFHRNRFYRADDAYLGLAGNPELQALNDGNGWNLEAVSKFIAGSVEQFPDQPPTPASATH